MLTKFMAKIICGAVLVVAITACNSNSSGNKAVAQDSASSIKKIHVAVGETGDPQDAPNMKAFLIKKLENNSNYKIVPEGEADYLLLFDVYIPSRKDVVVAASFIDYKKKTHATSTGLVLIKSLFDEMDKTVGHFNDFIAGKL